jgi:hypothetical protein
MNWRFILVVLGIVFIALPAKAAPALNLSGYTDAEGAISIQHKGNTVDPYFALQALLLAHTHGLDISLPAKAWAQWLVQRQKPDATFDRYCRNGPVWAACKTADADDSVLGLWMAFIDTLPNAQRQLPHMVRSRSTAQAALAKLVDPGRGIYLVSPVYQHGLFMDNLELWAHSFTHPATQTKHHPNFTRAIEAVFWDAQRQRYLVSTQPGQRDTPHNFYPDAVAQIFPLLVKFPRLPGGAAKYYREWMKEHRKEWLVQVHDDFAWGLIAIVALDQNDLASARCWLQISLPYRHSSHWTVTDEVAAQILQHRGLTAHTDKEACPQGPHMNNHKTAQQP